MTRQTQEAKGSPGAVPGEVQGQLRGALPGAGGFPGEESLCEGCGYPLRGLRVGQVCPECGKPIEESDPALRRGLAWQERMGWAEWVKTGWQMLRRPVKGFEQMRFAGPREWWRNGVRERVYLLTIAGMVGLVWAVVWWVVGMRGGGAWGVGVGVGVLILSYVEMAGVAYYGKRRGWRVSLRVAERVVCYSAIWWAVAAGVFFPLCVAYQTGVLERWWPTSLGRWGLMTQMFVVSSCWGLSILGFEMLVWLGIRKVKYANWDNEKT